GKLPKGAYRPLSTMEIRRLRAAAARPGGQGPAGVRPRVPLGRSFRPRPEERPRWKRERPALAARPTERRPGESPVARRPAEKPPARRPGQRPPTLRPGQ